MMAWETLGKDELPLVRVPVGMSSRLSGVVGTKHPNQKTDEQELVPTADEQELVPTVLPA
jgi:hypothetical protein